ncbi:MAG: CRISPR system precrRNA processing endoribonuclease RAMP protein Cas6 [Chloroflexi bacterium]|nr:CRISPR system precrRNA processing endoribonuclease RAMP protein Cas6 [Chloroflexota bacterium]
MSDGHDNVTLRFGAEPAHTVEQTPPERADLWACTITLVQRSGPPLLRNNQRQVHAAFLSWLRESDALLTAELHRPNTVRPFTVALLSPPPARERDDPYRPRAVQLRCTLLHRWIFDSFAQHCLSDSAHVWRVRAALFEQVGVSFVPTPTGWTGWTSFSDLLGGSTSRESIEVEFATPAAFSFGETAAQPPGDDDPATEVGGERPAPGTVKHIELFPRPRWLWESWARKWNAFAPPELALDVARIGAAAERVLVAGYHLHTVTLDYGRFPQKGFAGWARFDLRRLDLAEQRVLDTLSHFAFYSGTGYKTALGMGQTRRR